MMDTKIDGMPFGELMNQAVKLKTHQAKPDRYKFDKYPKFYQNSMFARDEIVAARAMAFPERMAAALNFKQEANKHYTEGRMLDASLKYEYALSVFKHLTNNDEGWKKKGILDKDITEHEYKAADEDEAAQIKDLFVSVYLNLARTYHKQRDTTTGIQACDAALELDETCDKALFLRAQIRIAPASAGGVEAEMATKDTSAALRCIKEKLAHGSGGSVGDGESEEKWRDDLMKRQKEVSRMLKRLRDEKREQTVKDKEFAGAFHRGEIYRPDEEPTKPAGPLVVHGADGGGAAAEGGEEVPAQVIRQLNDARRLIQLYREQGKHDDADRVQEEVDKSVKKIEEHKKQAKLPPPKMDFKNPTKEMIDDAKERGIDLTDPKTVALLESMQNEQQKAGKPLSEADLDEKVEDYARAEEERMMGEVSKLVSEMPLRDVMSSLKDMGVDHSHLTTKQELEELLTQTCIAKVRAGEPLPEPSSSGVSASTRRAIWIGSFAVAFAFMSFRLYDMGLFDMMLGRASPTSSHFHSNAHTDMAGSSPDSEWDDEF